MVAKMQHIAFWKAVKGTPSMQMESEAVGHDHLIKYYSGGMCLATSEEYRVQQSLKRVERLISPPS